MLQHSQEINIKQTFEVSKTSLEEISLIAEKLNSSLELKIEKTEKPEEGLVKLSLVDSHFHCEKNKFHHLKNPEGRINFVTALNAEIPKVFHQYIEDKIEFENLCYQRLGGKEEINEIAYADTKFNLDETLTFHSLASVIDAFFHFFKKISVENIQCNINNNNQSNSYDFNNDIIKDINEININNNCNNINNKNYKNDCNNNNNHLNNINYTVNCSDNKINTDLVNFLMPIFNHSRALWCEVHQSNAHLAFYPQNANFISDFLENKTSKTQHLIIVLKSKSAFKLLNLPESFLHRVSFCYEMHLKKGVEFAVVQTKDKSLYSSLYEQNWSFLLVRLFRLRLLKTSNWKQTQIF